MWGGWPVKRCKVSRKAYSYSEQRSTVTLWVLLCVYNHLQRVQAWIHACLYAYGNAKGIQESATEFYTWPYQYKIRCSKENRNQVRKLYTFSLPLALWFRLVLSVAAWIVPMSHELEKDGRNQNDPNCPWQNSFRKRNVNLSPSRASCQATLPHASQVSTNPASRPLIEEVLVWHYHRQIAAILLVYKRYRSRT